ncbi:hypothetical protein SAMN05421805_101632 [Saccharopolyspora antimicrobica]|uniref:Guanylate cyclase domain-containing protein n=1 Tax=Saccharopolyspora antimicrobica TaxID=455193 RepID=A0A1I4RNX7_9PSEU|nr:hypothetical protein [Saccharopolyspora antimicrobica]RKT87936.1 hypothetical protein ATL45_6359 [Saccharopolyspora antimicrobica]SFM53869.1 hypothetical protein SAMN05421805_101632 [Saccharopolyspora antimicrobica]
MDDQPQEINRPVGDYIGILAVDVHGFSEHNTNQQQTIVQVLADVLQQAAIRTGLRDNWDHHFRAYRGDGYLMGVRPELVAVVVDKFFDSLQAELRRRAPPLRTDDITLRLRASLHLGPVQAFDALLADSPTGRVMVNTNRMVDAKPVKALLDHSDPAVTHVASVISSSVMEDVVRAGHTTRKPTEYVQAPLEVEGKEYSGVGFLRVPAPSGELLRSGLLFGQPEPEPDDDAAAREAGGGQVQNAVDGPAENVVQAQQVRDFTDNSARSSGIAVNGNNNTTAGGGIDQSQNKQEFSGRFYTQGDSNFGQSSGRRVATDDTSMGR